MAEKNIGVAVKELTLGKEAIVRLLQQIGEKVKEAEATVEEENKRGLLSVINGCAEYLHDIAHGLPADQAGAKYHLNRCLLALGMPVEDEGLEL